MSQVLTRLSKASPLRGFRMFSSSSVTGPFLRLGSMVKVDKDVPDDILLFDAAKEEYLTVPETPLPQELADTTVVESSHGWRTMRWWKLAQREHKVQPWKQLTVPVSSNKDHGLPLDVIAAGDAPCLKRAGLPCGGGGPTMENINSG
ncbi:hypothetical protein Bca52824_072888 [Brassica carinata]|uniref:Uncharacterized protein n=1 Tax=Brassica carinata TaxID=52824 RepID=A0A8X7QEA9_BRACI|nr:hypothetical protein Bca52824_072888 [Brassica carinata]